MTPPTPICPWEQPRSILVLAIWFGLITGVADALLLFVLHLLHRCILDFYTPLVWTIPLSNAVAMLIPGLGFYLWALFRGVTPRFRKVALIVLGTFSVATIIFAASSIFIVRLFPLAVILLAAGIAVQFARLAANRPQQFHRLFARSTPVIIALTLLCGLVVEGRYWWTEHRLLKNLPAATPGAPNVLLLVLDTVRAKSMSLYGHPKETTPSLERWAGRGVVFEQAIAPSPFTLSSHASMFTGRYPHQLAADWAVPLEKGFPTIAEILHQHGYLTAGFVANTYYAGRQTGLDRGFGHFIAHRYKPLDIFVTSALCRTLLHLPRLSPRASAINQHFTRWLDRAPQRPYFAFLNYCDCHAPYDPEPEYQTASIEEQRQVFFWGIEGLMSPQPDLNPAHLNAALNAYETCLRGLDRRINELLKHLEQRGQLRNTIVIIVGDHGEQFGEHNIIQHADSLYRPALHVPLMIIAPDSPSAGKRVRQMVNLRDLPATILDLLKLPAATGIPGDSFAAAITNSPDAPLPSGPQFAFVRKGINYPSWHPNSTGDVTAVFHENKYLIKNPAGEELYDFQTDPEEQHNLINDTNVAPLLQRLRPLLPVRALN